MHLPVVEFSENFRFSRFPVALLPTSEETSGAFAAPPRSDDVLDWRECCLLLTGVPSFFLSSAGDLLLRKLNSASSESDFLGLTGLFVVMLLW